MSEKGEYVYEWPRPMVTADAVLFTNPDNTSSCNNLQVLLVKRKNEPFKGKWALPGGFIEMDEELAAAAERELFEETGIRVTGLKEVGIFGTVDRDPRGRVITVAYVGTVEPEKAEEAVAGDDAAEVNWFNVNELPDLAFDHDNIIRAAIRLVRDGG